MKIIINIKKLVSIIKNKTFFLILASIPLFIGIFIGSWTNTKISIPLGSLIFSLTGLIICALVIIGGIIVFYEMKKEKQKSKPFTKILSNLCVIIFFIICMFLNIKNIYLSVKDIIQGPKQIEISEPEFLTRHTSGKGSRKYYYLVGSVNGKRERIEIEPKDSDYVEEKIKECKTISIYYHKNLNKFYKIAEDYE